MTEIRFGFFARIAAAGAAALAVSATLAAAQTSLTGFTVDDVLGVRTASVADVSRDGRWAVTTIFSLRDWLGDDESRWGDPTYIAPRRVGVSIVDTRTGESHPLFQRATQATGFAWSPDASQLAFVLRDGDFWRLVIWERERDRMREIDLPENHTVTVDHFGPPIRLHWSDDGSMLLFPMRRAAWRSEVRRRFLEETEGPIVVHSSEDPFLSWEEIRRLGLVRVPALYHVADDRVEILMPEARLSFMALTGDGRTLVYQEDITGKTPYDERNGTESRLVALRIGSSERRTLIESIKGAPYYNYRPLASRDVAIWSGDNRSWIHAEGGSIWYRTIEGEQAKRLTGSDRTRSEVGSGTPRAEQQRSVEASFTPLRLDHDGTWLIAVNREGYWLIDTTTGRDRQLFLATEGVDGSGNAGSPRYSIAAWTRDGNAIYISSASRTQWERGVLRFDRRTGRLTELVRDARYYSGLRVSDDGSTVVLTIAEGNRPGDVFVADSVLRNLRQLTDANPGIEKKLARTELLKYRDADGVELYGVLYYPLGHRPGIRVPTVLDIYESYFDDRFSSMVNLLTSAGYAVVQPSVHFETGFPGEAWLKGVTAAANEVIEMGVADPDRLGVQGESHGGYATSLLITQTDRFAAAINISGKTDLVSFYFDSPRLGTRNIHSPEQGQDRIGATLWQQPQKYVAHSPVMFADRVKTPLLLLTGREDHNIPETTSRELYFALRRLGRRVEWVSYTNGGHGVPTRTEAEVRDFYARVLSWYDRYLKNSKEDSVTRH